MTFFFQTEEKCNLTSYVPSIKLPLSYITGFIEVKKIYSCTPDKDIHVIHLDLQILSHPCYLIQKSPELVVLEVTYLRRQVTLVCSAVTSKNDITLCKLDVNVKNRTAVAGSVSLFKLE